MHLHIVGNALGLVFQPRQQQSLALQVLHHGVVQLADGTGQLLLHGVAAEAGHLAHGGKLAAHGVQVLRRGGHSLGFRVGIAVGTGGLQVRKAGHAHAGLPGGGVGCLGGRQIQHDIRRGHGIFQRSALVGGQVGAQAQHIAVGGVGVLEGSGVLLAHQQREGIQRALAHCVGQGAFDAALLDAGVHDLAGVVRQRQIAVRLHEQQCEHHEADGPVTGQLLKDLCHGLVLPSVWWYAQHFPREWLPSARRAALPSGPAVPAPAGP